MVKSTAIMTEQARRDWLAGVSNSVRLDLVYKFERGQAEHGSDLGAVPLGQLVVEMHHEVLDQIAYVNEIKRRLALLESEQLKLVVLANQLIQDKEISLPDTCFIAELAEKYLKS